MKQTRLRCGVAWFGLVRAGEMTGGVGGAVWFQSCGDGEVADYVLCYSNGGRDKRLSVCGCSPLFFVPSLSSECFGFTWIVVFSPLNVRVIEKSGVLMGWPKSWKWFLLVCFRSLLFCLLCLSWQSCCRGLVDVSCEWEFLCWRKAIKSMREPRGGVGREAITLDLDLFFWVLCDSF